MLLAMIDENLTLPWAAAKLILGRIFMKFYT